MVWCILGRTKLSCWSFLSLLLVEVLTVQLDHHRTKHRQVPVGQRGNSNVIQMALPRMGSAVLYQLRLAVLKSKHRVRHQMSRDSLKDKRLSPEENLIHHFAAGQSIEDAIEVDFTVVAFLGLEVAGLHDPYGELCVKTTQVVTIWTLALKHPGQAEMGEE